MRSAYQHGAGGDAPRPAPRHPPPQRPRGLPPPPAENFPAGHFRSSSRRRRNGWQDAVFPRRNPGRGNPGRESGRARTAPAGTRRSRSRLLTAPSAEGRRAPLPASPQPRPEALLPSGARSGSMALEKSLGPERSGDREKGGRGAGTLQGMEEERDGAGRS